MSTSFVIEDASVNVYSSFCALGASFTFSTVTVNVCSTLAPAESVTFTLTVAVPTLLSYESMTKLHTPLASGVALIGGSNTPLSCITVTVKSFAKSSTSDTVNEIVPETVSSLSFTSAKWPFSVAAVSVGRSFTGRTVTETLNRACSAGSPLSFTV